MQLHQHQFSSKSMLQMQQECRDRYRQRKKHGKNMRMMKHFCESLSIDAATAMALRIQDG